MVSKSFFVVRDSVKPKLKITFDGKQIVDGDVVSAKPHIELRLVDDSPLPMDTTNFILYYNNRLLSFAKDSLAFTYTADPEKAAVVTWNPVLKKGNNFLDIKAKDATGNPFTEDSGYYRINFFVYDKNDIQLAYNYPNPFTDGTYFTFELRGVDLPQTVTIKIFTVAGRLIKQIDVPRTSVDFSFNKVYWDGRDVDGNELANGTYFYKIIARYADKARTATQRLVKMR
jgi:hypothetical protein